MDCVEMSSITCRILGPLVLGWAPNHFILGAQLAPVEKMLVCIPDVIHRESIAKWLKKCDFTKTVSFLDAGVKEFLQAGYHCFKCHGNRHEIIQDLKELWTNSSNPNFVLPCLAVRSGLDLFLKVKAFPSGSEIIMSAINIPDMVSVVKHHQLQVIDKVGFFLLSNPPTEIFGK